MANLLVAQSGGPTAAINATLTGVLEIAQISNRIDNVYGAINGIEGVFSENFIVVSDIVRDTKTMDALANTPASALGSCRYKMKDPTEDDSECKRVIEIFRKHNIETFIYIGGNDSMDTVSKLSNYCKINGIEDIRIMGAPKTIDNDLAKTDHCPGFGSAAKYIGTTFAELERDIAVYKSSGVLIVEIMGRNAGWLTAASALSRLNGGKGPDLIYLCEVPFSTDKFISNVKELLDKKGSAIVAISEGLRCPDGRYLSEQMTEQTSSDEFDVFGHKYIAGAGQVLEEVVRKQIGCKVRSIELNLMQRCASHVASATDLNEAKMLGMKAVQCALEGRTGEMAIIQRLSSSPYEIKFSSVDVNLVANEEKTVPSDYINEEGNDVTEKMIEYLKPLVEGETTTYHIGGIPTHVVLYEK
ncbi:MAG: 6-phosphofructokinase [Lachnospiraceae bacterium]|nr:6-phosphofructokinase [Lachnospiraceae bacterium]